MQEAEQCVREWFGHLTTRPSWGISNSYGSWIRMNFGEPSLDVRDPAPEARSAAGRHRRVAVQGEYQLLVELADWTLEIPNWPEVTSESSRRDVRRALARLEGQIITHVKLNSSPVTSVFGFDLGAVLSVASYEDAEPDFELWHLFHEGRELSLEASGLLVVSDHETGIESCLSFKGIELG